MSVSVAVRSYTHAVTYVAELDRTSILLQQETEKSIPGFFKNLARDGGEVVVYAVPGLVESVFTEAKAWLTWADGRCASARAKGRSPG